MYFSTEMTTANHVSGLNQIGGGDAETEDEPTASTSHSCYQGILLNFEAHYGFFFLAMLSAKVFKVLSRTTLLSDKNNLYYFIFFL
jgi:hypothetical protein